MNEEKDLIKELFGMPLFPHLYAIPLSMILGVVIGYYMRGRMESTPERLPQKPKV